MDSGFERIQLCEEWRGRAERTGARDSGGKDRASGDRAKRSECAIARDGGGLRGSDSEASRRVRRPQWGCPNFWAVLQAKTANSAL